MRSVGIALSLCAFTLVGCGSDDKSSPSAVATAGGAGSGAGGAGGSSGSGFGGMQMRPPPDPCIAAGTCPPGQWVDVTPAAVNLSADFPCGACNFGVQDVLVDPALPNNVYAFICYQGVWHSSDYGMTWTHVSTGTNADHLEHGRPWTAAIDPNPGRDPGTPPTLYTASGYGDVGLYKSTDGGVNWTIYPLNNTQGVASSDVYSIEVDPNNSNHLVAGFHDVGMSESTNGGETWATLPVPANFGGSVYIWFVNTGSIATTSTTWLTMAQWNNNSAGMWRTVDSGKNWTQVNDLEHGHGSSQVFQDGQGHIYAAGASPTHGALQMSSDYGVTWDSVNSNGVPQNGVFGSPNYVYATLPAASQGVTTQHLQRAAVADGRNWADWDPIAPPNMTNGAKRGAVAYDGNHYVIVTGNWLAGIWRYVEN